MASRLSDDDSYHGRCVRRLTIAGLLLYERTYPPHLEIPLHSHNGPSMCVVLQGGCTETCGGRVWTYTPRTLCLRPPGEPHADRFGEAGGRVFGLELGSGWPDRLAAHRRTLERPAALDGLCTGLARKLHREFRLDGPAAPLIVEGLVLEILGEACRAAPPAGEAGAPRWLRQVRDILHDRYGQPPGLAAVADEVGVHPLHLARVFRRTYGCSVGEYVRRLRVEFACRELARPGRSLVGIALEAGFSDQSQFCRTFKRHVGLTPSQFRREARSR
jgi:AraC family transcriptional regulator